MKHVKFIADENHPLFQELSRIFIDDKVKKNDVSFLNMRKVMESELSGLILALGSDHPKTAERYQSYAEYVYS